jgi:hypothetical protein
MACTTTQFKPGDRVIWLRSPGRSIVTGWRVERIPGVVVGVCRHRLRVRLNLHGEDRTVTVNPENVLDQEADGWEVVG